MGGKDDKPVVLITLKTNGLTIKNPTKFAGCKPIGCVTRTNLPHKTRTQWTGFSGTGDTYDAISRLSRLEFLTETDAKIFAKPIDDYSELQDRKRQERGIRKRVKSR